MTRFVNRNEELSRLHGCYESDDAEMVVIFGRRRLGKTQLVQHSLVDRDDAVVYQATETTSQIQLDEFVDVAAETFPEITQIRQNWEALLGYLGTKTELSSSTNFRTSLTPTRAFRRSSSDCGISDYRTLRVRSFWSGRRSA